MPTTTNYGWTTPADTDLVKDGAAAIRTLGNSVDTTTKNLNPETTLGDISYRSSTANTNTRLPIGTTGQVLTVVGGVPAWSSETGDITEVQAGTGISVASGTGPIPVVTNTVATTFDAKGDLVAGTGADTFAKITVGANDTVLTADSTTATGLKWATPSSSGMTLLSTTTLSSTTTTVNITPTGYVYLYFTINKMGFTGGATPLLTRLNGQTGSNYCYNNRTRDNVFSKASSSSSISSVNDYDNSDAQYVWGILTLPNATTKRPTVELNYYYNSASNQGFGQSWGAFEGAQAAITSITFFSSNGTSTFVNSPQLLIYGVK